MSNELDIQKQELSTNSESERTRTGKVYIPRVDIYDTEEKIVLVADMPGVDESNIDITLEKNLLTLHGSVTIEQPDNYSLAYAEYEVGDYERSFTLSNEIDNDNIEATVSNGVLTLNLPKMKEAATRKIAVKAVA